MSLSNALSYLTVLPIPFKKHIPLNRSVNVWRATGHEVGTSFPWASRTSGVVARSGADSGVSDSHPLGQAIPMFTG